MKNNLFKLTAATLSAVLILASCSRDNSVVSNRGIQKRKHTGGFHIELNKKHKSVKDNKIEENEVAFNENFKTVETPVAIAKIEKVVTSEVKNTENTFAVVSPVQVEKAPVAITKKEVTKTSKKAAKSSSVNQSSTLALKNSKSEMKNSFSAIKSIAKESKKENKKSDLEPILYILLCLIIPFVAVGLATNWEVRDVVINLLLCCLCGIPGIIHAFIVCNREGVI